MSRASLTHRRADRPTEPVRRASSGRAVAARPPQSDAPRAWSSRLGDWLDASGWRVSGADAAPLFGQRTRLEALAAARLEFADALADVTGVEAAIALDRIAVTRSLHELWYLRGEVFGEVSRRHDQAEAERRLAALDRHFASRSILARWRHPIGTGADDTTER